MVFMETSSKVGLGVEELFVEVGRFGRFGCWFRREPGRSLRLFGFAARGRCARRLDSFILPSSRSAQREGRVRARVGVRLLLIGAA
jgi:hypothetical protein